MMAISLG